MPEIVTGLTNFILRRRIKADSCQYEPPTTQERSIAFSDLFDKLPDPDEEFSFSAGTFKVRVIQPCEYIERNKDRRSDIDVADERHEETRKVITEKIDELAKKLAKKDDIIKAKEEIIQKIEAENEELKSHFGAKIDGLQNNLLRFLPYVSGDLKLC